MPRLGTIENPARIRVRSLAKAKELHAFCKKNRWTLHATVDLISPENTDDIKTLMSNAFLEDDQIQNSSIATDPIKKKQIKKIARNEPCHCGSGKKYKKCCLV